MALDPSRFTTTIDGKDVSAGFAPHLTSIEVQDQAGSASDSATLEFDDADGAIVFPRSQAAIAISLADTTGMGLVFRGTVDEVKSNGSRGSGRTLTITAKGADTSAPVKEGRERHWDGQTLGKVLDDAAKAHGLDSAKVAPALASIQLTYVAQQGESLLSFGQRLARENGGTFRISGKVAVMVERSAGTSATGKALANVVASWGDNLIDWNVSPVVSRPRYASTRARHHDRKANSWKSQTSTTGIKKSRGRHTHRFSRAHGAAAVGQAKSDASESQRQSGQGTCTIDGNTAARPEGTLTIRGARAGVDGDYRIDGVTHTYNSSGGFTTQLQLREPHGSAGEDNRTAS